VSLRAFVSGSSCTSDRLARFCCVVPLLSPRLPQGKQNHPVGEVRVDPSQAEKRDGSRPFRVAKMREGRLKAHAAGHGWMDGAPSEWPGTQVRVSCICQGYVRKTSRRLALRESGAFPKSPWRERLGAWPSAELGPHSFGSASFLWPRGTADDRLHRWHKSFRNAVKRHHLLLGPLYAASRMVRVATR
jgi:hypothetical protein